eukprot:TRINITY_DN10570_c0_g1_i2.p1 TRINITY_DN10570_c0_g1~~TRINITY_DN10570_c0_g1_i2.p1  ORF type:complete len:202 (-),score=47.97 TRINITY_DN10570_c0_g1_i2:44-649(-)
MSADEDPNKTFHHHISRCRQKDYYQEHLLACPSIDNGTIFPFVLVQLIAEFASLKVDIGVRYDVLDSDGRWCVGVVQDLRFADPPSATVHFIGWSPKWDQEIPLSVPKQGQDRIQPLFSQINPRTFKPRSNRPPGAGVDQTYVSFMVYDLGISTSQANRMMAERPSTFRVLDVMNMYLYWREFGDQAVDEELRTLFNSVFS